MDLSDPTRSVSATLDGTVLAVLATAGRPLTVGQVAAQASRGSEIGIRRTLARLVEQGIVRSTLMGRNHVHELNRDHVAAEIAEMLADLRPMLWKRFREELDSWQVQPLYACVFGSAARGDGDVDSDIDLLLVHPPLPGERRGSVARRGGMPGLLDARRGVAVAAIEADSREWEEQVDRLRDRVQAWTGNSLQVVDLSLHQAQRQSHSNRSLWADIERDGVELRGSSSLPGTQVGR